MECKKTKHKPAKTRTKQLNMNGKKQSNGCQQKRIKLSTQKRQQRLHTQRDNFKKHHCLK